eukprot:gene9396-11060_t
MSTHEDNLLCPLSTKDEPPWVDGTKFLCNGHVVDCDLNTKGCFSPITKSEHEKRTQIGSVPMMNESLVEAALHKSRQAWDNRNGVWPKTAPLDRISCMRRVIITLQQMRDEIIRIILWDASKTLKEANQEYNDAMGFAEDVLCKYEELGSHEQPPLSIGIVLCWGAETNSFVETYRFLIPALVTGNIVIMKIPCVGGLVHVLTMEAFTTNLPDNAIQFVAGPIDVVAGPLLGTGEIDMLALSGARSLADRLIHAHLHPHRLKLLMHLDSETLGVVLPDADLACASNEITKALRPCRSHTAGVRLVFAHTSIVLAFVEKLCTAVRQLKCGLPWTKGVDITPLPGNNQIEHLQDLLIDALQMGAMIVNHEDGGGRLLPEFHGTIMQPAVVYPVNDTMKLWRTKITGPIVSVVSYEHIDEARAYIARSSPDLQACVFTAHPEHNPDLQSLLRDPPHRLGAVTVNQVCLEQHVAGYGRVPVGLNSQQGTWDSSTALRAFTTEPLLRGVSLTGNCLLAPIDTSTEPAMTEQTSFTTYDSFHTTEEARAKTVDSNDSSSHTCHKMPGKYQRQQSPFPSPTGVAAMHSALQD